MSSTTTKAPPPPGEDLEDLILEFHDCARYDELEDLKQRLTDPRIQIDAVDFNGSTALHKAAANGHTEIVEFLISRGAKYTRNLSGHTPLSWAVQCQQLESVKLLIRAFDEEIDVLLKPPEVEYAKSILHLAFDSGDPKIVETILAHRSAKPLEKDTTAQGNGDEGGDEKEEEDTEGEEVKDGSSQQERKQQKKKTTSESQHRSLSKEEVAEHHFSFPIRVQKPEPQDTAAAAAAEATAQDATRTPDEVTQPEQPKRTEAQVRIRELPIQGGVESVFDQTHLDSLTDQTGLALWSSAIVLSRWIADRPEFVRGGKTICELGAGCGLPGITAGVVGGPGTEVWITDFAPAALENLRYNVGLNKDALEGVEVRAESLDWTNPETWPKTRKQKQEQEEGEEGEEEKEEKGTEVEQKLFDLLLISDGVYQEELVEPLVDTVDGLLRPEKGELLMVAPHNATRQGMDRIVEGFRRIGLRCVTSGTAPKRYRENCSSRSKDAEADAGEAGGDDGGTPPMMMDDETFFLYFNELLLHEFRLLRFVREQSGPLVVSGKKKKKKKKKRKNQKRSKQRKEGSVEMA